MSPYKYVCVCVCVLVCVCVCLCVCSCMNHLGTFMGQFNLTSADVGGVGTSPEKKLVHQLSNMFFSMYVRYEKMEEMFPDSRLIGILCV